MIFINVSELDTSEEYECVLVINYFKDDKYLALHDKDTMEPLFMIVETQNNTNANDILLEIQTLSDSPVCETITALLRNIKHDRGTEGFKKCSLAIQYPIPTKHVVYCWRCTWAKYDANKKIEGKRYWIGMDEVDSSLYLVDCDNPLYTLTIKYLIGDPSVKECLINPSSNSAIVRVDDRIRTATKTFDIKKAENAPKDRDEDSIDKVMHDVKYVFVAEDYDHIPDEYRVMKLIYQRDKYKIVDFEFDHPVNKQRAYEYIQEHLKCKYIKIEDDVEINRKKMTWSVRIPADISLENMEVLNET